MNKALLDRTPLCEIRPEEQIISDINSLQIDNSREQAKLYYEANKAEIWANTLREKEKEINRLNNIIDEFQRNYIEIIKRCDEMIKNKYYSNATAIDKYANEIKNIVKYYVPDAEIIELKGDNK